MKVLSESISKALYFSSNDEAFETAYFIGKMDKFFDTLNVSSFAQGKLKRNDFRLTVCSQWHYIASTVL